MMLYSIVLIVMVAGHPVEFIGKEKFTTVGACNHALLDLAMTAGASPWRSDLSCKVTGQMA